jgi:protein-S-isoprenylcysteine O-methyltransferase Ste14
MHMDEPGARIGHRGTAISRAKLVALKALVVIGGVVTLASAFVLSVAFLAIGLVVVLTVGGYLWWKTRELRKEMRARMQAPPQPQSAGDFIEGEVIERGTIDREAIPGERTRH